MNRTLPGTKGIFVLVSFRGGGVHRKSRILVTKWFIVILIQVKLQRIYSRDLVFQPTSAVDCVNRHIIEHVVTFYQECSLTCLRHASVRKSKVVKQYSGE